MTTQPDETENEAPKKGRAERPVIVQFQQAPAGAPSGPRASRPEKWVALAEDGEYAEHQIRMRLNFPDAISQEIVARDSAAMKRGLSKIILEHNGWLDADRDEPTMLPPTTQVCEFDTLLEKSLADESVTFQDALKRAAALKDNQERKSAKLAAETAHEVKVQQLHLDTVTRKAAPRDAPCCFWDSLSSEEILLILKAINENKRKRTNFLLETPTG